MTKLSNSGAGKPINALWQMKDRDVVYQRGGYWINGAWVDGDEEDLFSLSNTTSIFYPLIGYGVTEIAYYGGFIFMGHGSTIPTPYDLVKINNLGDITVLNSSYNFGMCIAIDEINGHIYADVGYKVMKFTLDGTYVGVLGGGAGTNFYYVNDIIVNTSVCYAYKYDYQGNPALAGTLADPDFDPSPYPELIGVIYNDLYLYIVEDNQRKITKTKFDGTNQTVISGYKDPSTGYEDYKFAANPQKIVNIHDNGYFIVSETIHTYSGQNYISLIKFKFDGSYWERINFPYGTGDFQLIGSHYNNMLYKNGVLYLTDGGSGRVIKTDPDFSTWKAINLRTLYANATPCGITLDTLGDLYIHDWNLTKTYKTSYFNS